MRPGGIPPCRELFGASFKATGERFSDGFAALAELDRSSAGGNGLRQHGRFVRIAADGTRSEHSVVDVWFKTRAL